MKVDIVTYSDWVQIFVDGELKDSGHSFSPWAILEAVGISVNEYDVDDHLYQLDAEKLTHLPEYVREKLGE